MDVPQSMAPGQAFPVTASDVHIFSSEVKGEPSAIEKTRIVEAYGTGKCPKLVREMQDPDRSVRIAALKACKQVFKSPIDVGPSVNAGAVGVLASLVRDDDVSTRIHASAAFNQLCTDATGQAAVLGLRRGGAGQNTTVMKVIDAFSDPETEVRMNMYEALLQLCRLPVAVDLIVGSKYSELLVGKSGSEEAGVQPLALDLLRKCLQNMTGMQSALDSGAVSTCVQLLDSPHSEVRRSAADTLMTLCMSDAGKISSIKEGAIPKLCSLLTDSGWQVQAAAAGALMNINVEDDAKKITTQSGGVENLCKLLLNEDAQRLVTLNTLKAIAAIAPYPDARMRLKIPAVNKKLAELEKYGDSLVAKSAITASQAVNWMP